MQLTIKANPKIVTKNAAGEPNGFLVPIYNVNDGFFPVGEEPKQVYLTVISPNMVKGPHLHFIRTGCFTCIKGNVRFILKVKTGYEVVYSGESYNYRTLIVPAGVPAALHNLGSEDAYVVNTPTPAWTPDMNDEHSADFSDFDFNS